MPSLSDTIQRLSRLGAMGMGMPDAQPGRLSDIDGFGSNPGALRARYYLPGSLAECPALVVVLHGCTQTAAGYDIGSGWSELADQHGFALLYPEQQRHNNPNLCFNWFVPEDGKRDSGEALSIRQMIATMVDRHAIDPTRIFVTGLSAGGAMASILLATYPEVFAGGGIIAGLPYGSAGTVPEAFDRMRGHGGPGASALSALVRDASDHRGSWPTISVWHGSADSTVHPDNADAIVDQWRALHGVGARPDRIEHPGGHPRRVWCDATGREVIEELRITGMGHGTPVDTLGAAACGKSGAYMLEAGISSTRHLCQFWGLSNGEPIASDRASTPLREPSTVPAPHAIGVRASEPTGIAATIEGALRAAGLMQKR